MNLTTKQLKTQTWGTPCGPGNIGNADNHLSHSLIIDFIDTFFGGILKDVETDVNYDKKDLFWLLGGNPTLTKLTITNDEFNKFLAFSDKENFIEDFCYYTNFNIEDFEDIENKIQLDYHPEIICSVFQLIFGMRCEYLDNGNLEIESE